MPTGSDGDEELLLEELEPESEEPVRGAAPPPTLPILPAVATSAIPDGPSFEEAAAADARADVALFEGEAAGEPRG
ncbi:MAG TPA: hypothetical protein VLA14_16005, partial [Polyangia bacterium]|nr:hypothetical protein [Polyangia bacterium]